eukprot:4461432-Heterocapsa_arctica.AAC.1
MNQERSSRQSCHRPIRCLPRAHPMGSQYRRRVTSALTSAASHQHSVGVENSPASEFLRDPRLRVGSHMGEKKKSSVLLRAS